MRYRSAIDLLITAGITLLLIPTIVFSPSDIPRIILGLPFVLFLPGYALVSTLFPRKSSLGGIERAAYSLALSIAIVALTGLLLNYVWSITLYPMLGSVSVIVLALTMTAWYRRRNLPEAENVYLRVSFNFIWSRTAAVDRVLYGLLALAVIGAVVASVYTYNKNQESFSELYLLGPAGKAAGYPQSLAINQFGMVTLVISNSEHKVTDYTVKAVAADCNIRINGVAENQFNVSLADKEQKSFAVTFAFDRAGEGQKLEFDLYKEGQDTVYLATYLKVQVTE